MIIQAELSLYPLRESHLGSHIDAFLKAFRCEGLTVSMGTMSTVISGEREIVFQAVADGFARVSDRCDVVLHVKYSNACPTGSGASCMTASETVIPD